MFLIVEDILGIFLFYIYNSEKQVNYTYIKIKIKNIMTLKFSKINIIKKFTIIYLNEYFNISILFFFQECF